MDRSDKYKKDLLNGLKTVEGQVRGIAKMVEEDRYCVDLLVQLAAVKARINKMGLSIIESHTRGCVSMAIKAGQGDEYIEELVDIISKFVK
ncbi:MAG: transcriptional regulator [Firmicutes bacterium HGW-Firmicutes-14]|nr:MAG: transcriptional regulator [Firmicutes bacterium HGW-Firmicutes-14]